MLFLASVVYAVAVHLASPVIPEDDAFITYRYVSNLFAGEGLVYNPSERVFGSSTPLYLLWLSGLQLLFRDTDLPILAVRGNLIWYLASALVVTSFLYRVTRGFVLSLVLGSITIANPFLLDVSLGGMEPFLFSFLAFGALLALSHRRVALAAALAGLSAVTRPEGLLVLGIWGVAWLQSPRRWNTLMLAGLPLAAWIGLATLYYGTPVPHSVIAKNAPLYEIPVGQTLPSLLQLLTSWACGLRWPALPPLLASLPTVALPIAGSWWSLRNRTAPKTVPRSGTLLFWLMFLLYLKPNMLVFSWYLPAFYFAWLCVAAQGPQALSIPLARLLRRPQLNSLLSAGMVLVPLAVFPLTTLAALARYDSVMSYPLRSPSRVRVTAYQQAADWLNTRSSPTTTVAAPEIGALGYYFHGHIYDACGLVSPQALPFLPPPAQEREHGWQGIISTAFVRATRPDYVVTHPWFARRGLMGDPWFQEHYGLAHTVPLPLAIEEWGPAEILVFVRSSPAAH